MERVFRGRNWSPCNVIKFMKRVFIFMKLPTASLRDFHHENLEKRVTSLPRNYLARYAGEFLFSAGKSNDATIALWFKTA